MTATGWAKRLKVRSEAPGHVIGSVDGGLSGAHGSCEEEGVGVKGRAELRGQEDEVSPVLGPPRAAAPTTRVLPVKVQAIEAVLGGWKVEGRGGRVE